MRTILFCVALLWGNALVGNAQVKKVDLSKRVMVGETMPQVSPQSVLFYEREKIDLDEYQDKVMILDFFDTYCVACIESLPNLMKLQHQMSDKLQIVLVTWQDMETIQEFWSTNPFIVKHDIQLPIIYNDSMLRRCFPHRVIPHVAWLSNGKVQAITHSDFVSADRIQNLYTNGHINVPLKHDFEDSTIPFRSADHALGSVSLTGFQEGRPTSSYTYELDSLSGMYKTSFYNMPIFGAYTAVWSKIKKPTFILKPERMVWDVRDSSLYKNDGVSGTGQVWLSEHGICYERYDKHQRTLAQQAKVVLQDLNSLLGLSVYWSTRKMPALVIEGDYRRPKEINTIEGQKMEGTSVLAFSIDMKGGYPPVLDQVQSEELLVLPAYTNLEELNQHLRIYNLRVAAREVELEVMVFEEQRM